MPIFEFICTKCNQSFEELVRSASSVDEVNCPFCGSPEINKKISLFSSKAAGASSFSLNTGSSAACSPAGV
jgi:putative FmdB family regulatory protein